MRDDLLEKYAEFRPERNFCGWECGEGWWKEIIEPLFHKLKGSGIKFAQIKEKFGTLRIYANNSEVDVFNLIKQAEAESMKVCEYCGTRENITTEGSWVLTLCKKCRQERLDR
jgi:hypothetical protein